MGSSCIQRVALDSMKISSIPLGIPVGEKNVHRYLSLKLNFVSQTSTRHFCKTATNCANQGKWNRFFTKNCSEIS